MQHKPKRLHRHHARLLDVAKQKGFVTKAMQFFVEWCQLQRICTPDIPFMTPKQCQMFDDDHQDISCEALPVSTHATLEFNHIPVLLDPVCQCLAPALGDSYLDLTLGGAGHASAVAKMIGATGVIAGFDRDPRALAAARERRPDRSRRRR